MFLQRLMLNVSLGNRPGEVSLDCHVSRCSVEREPRTLPTQRLNTVSRPFGSGVTNSRWRPFKGLSIL